MSHSNHDQSTDRRSFLGTIAAAGATTLGLGALTTPFSAFANPESLQQPDPHPAIAWFEKVKGSHKVVFDATRPHEIMPFAWPRVFLMTNGATGTPETDCGVVLVLRHNAIPYAFENKMWTKYNFGKLFEAPDPVSKAANADHNPFWMPKAGDFSFPGIGPVPIGINELQASGVMICVCEAAIMVYSSAVAGQMKLDAAEVRKEWTANILPGIQPVPSGVWALGRAQEKGCAYVFAG
jgi:hypothetical protein